MIYAIANQKGGVGKTTTCLNVATVLAEQGKKVLMVDLDPQAGLTTSLGFNPEELQPTIYNLLIDGDELNVRQVILSTSEPNLDFIPANLDLSGAEIELIREMSWDRTLGEVLKPVRSFYDFIFVDCPPSLGVLTTNAFMAAKMVIVPVQSEYLAMRGLKQLQKIISKVQKKGNPGIQIKILRTMHDARTIHSTEIVDELKRVFDKRVFDAIIRRSVKFSEATAAFQPIIRYAENSPGALAYRDLVKEILEYEQNQTTSN
ncbi:MAG: ParA family protein [Smithellaceae bacterium]